MHDAGDVGLNEKALERLAVGPGGEIVPDPLVEWNFRFNARGNRWTRASLYRKGSYRRGLPRVVSRAAVAREVGVPEEAIAAWQAAFMARRSAVDRSDAESRLALGPDGSVQTNPLADWHVAFFPQSRVWRRTRGQRSEVSRPWIATKVGVSEELIQRWEQAAIAQWQREAP